MIPSVKLKPYISQIRGISFKPDEIADVPFENSVPLLKANNITNDGLNNSSLIYIDSNKIRPEQFIRAGDLLLAASSGSKKVIGKSAHFSEHFAGSFGAFCKLVRPKNGLHSDYLKHFFKTHYYRSSIEKAVQGANINNLRNEHLDDLEIPFPPLDDQIRIAHLLGKVEGLIAQRKQQLQQLDDLPKSVFLEMFGDPVRNEKGWERLPLERLGSLNRGVSKHRPRNAPELLGGKYPLIQTGEVSNAGTYITTFSHTYSEIGFAQSKLWPSGTLCITIAANIAQTGILTFDACFPDSVVAFSAFENEAHVLYVHGLFWFFQKILEKNAPAAAQKNINLEILRGMEVPKPPIELQAQFAYVVTKIEGIKSRYQQSLTDMEAIYGALSQRAFKGELDLSRVPLPAIQPEEESRGNRTLTRSRRTRSCHLPARHRHAAGRV